MSNKGIIVTATGVASGPPDRAVMTLGANAIRMDVATAFAAVNSKIENLISTLAGHGIQGPDIQTSDLWIHPEHNQEGSLAGFRVRNTVRVTTTALDGLGELISAATAVLGDLAEIYGLAFEVSDPAPLEAQARSRAWSLAHDRARQIADLAGARLGKAVEVRETHRYDQGMYAMDLASPRGAPIETGAASVEVYLQVRFAQFPGDNPSG
jgi:uncharacterized protein YggE